MASAWIINKTNQTVTSASLDEATAVMGNEDTPVWINLTPSEFEPMAAKLGFHPQAVEDAMKASRPKREASQRAKLDRFPNHVFLYVFRASVNDQGDLALDDVPLFVNRHSIIAVDTTPTFEDDDLVNRWRADPRLLQHGVTAMLYSALDIVVDSQLEAVDSLADVVDTLEDDLFSDGTSPATESREVQLRSFTARKSLVRLRRVSQPMREMTSGIMRAEDNDGIAYIDADMLPYYQDIYDHVLRVNDTIEGLRDLITTIYETRLAMYDHTLNTVTRQLAAWAAIIAVPTAVTGFYGQNIPYPGYLHASGFWASTITWVAISVILYVVFKRKEWL